MLALTVDLHSQLNFEETCVAFRKAVDAAKWSMMGGYDFSEVLAGKGFPTANRYKTFEICHAGYAADMLSAEPMIAMCMPCTVAVIEVDGVVRVCTVNPSAMISATFGASVAAKESTLAKVDTELSAMINAAIGHG